MPLAALCAAALFAGCRVRDVRTVSIATTGIETDKDLAAAVNALKVLPDSRLTNKRGDRRMCLEVVSFDGETGELRVRYDSMKVGVKNLEEALSKAGFGTPGFKPAEKKGPEKRDAGRGGQG